MSVKAFALLLAVAAVSVPWRVPAAEKSDTRTPVLLELFTSEGCSSCPPADEFLSWLDRTQPIAGANLVVISEHVNYWNRLGWIDQNSSQFFSDRQNAYAERLHSDDVYTPQLIVDGTYGVVGSDRAKAQDAIRSALRLQKTPVAVEGRNVNGSAHLHISIGGASGGGPADVYVVLALDHAGTRVTSGENSGRDLTHTAVAFSVRKVGTLEKVPFVRDIVTQLGDNRRVAQVRVVVFAQDTRTGRILGIGQVKI